MSTITTPSPQKKSVSIRLGSQFYSCNQPMTSKRDDSPVRYIPLPKAETTHQDGPQLLIDRPLTKGALVRASEAISRRLAYLYGRPEGSFRIEPECSTEGGLLWADWPDRQENAYKSMRFLFENSADTWPMPPVDVMNAWRDNDEPALAMNRTIFLKAFYGAPQWTRAELTIFMTELERAGASLGTFPKRLKLP